MYHRSNYAPLIAMAFRLLFLATLIALPALAFAQPGPDRLPNLTPTEFEITGELEINLPQLERQPLSGFGPPPRTYVVPAERQASTRPYRLAYDGLPGYALPTPADPDFALADGRIFRVEGGLGTEIARYGRFDFANALLFADVDYDGLGSTSDVVNGTPDPFVTFNRLDARGGLRTSGDVTASITGLVNYNDYSLPATPGPNDKRTITMFGAEAEIGTGTLVQTPGGVSFSVVRTNVDTDLSTIPLSTSDTRLEAALFSELLKRLVRIEGGGGMSSFIDGSDGTDLYDYNGGLILQAYAGAMQFKAGARVLGYSTSPLNGDVSTTVFAPVASVELPMGASGRLFAFTDPNVEQRGLFELMEANPFTQIGFLAPNINTVDGEGGIELRSGSVGLKVYGGATISPTYQVFERNTGTGLFGTAYDKARILSAGGDVSYTTPQGIELSAGGAFRNGSLTEQNESIPYFAQLVGRVGAQVPFADGRARVGLSAYFEGERPADRFETRMLPGFGMLGIDAAYEFTQGISFVLRGERLVGDAERWEGFPQASTTILGGIRLVR